MDKKYDIVLLGATGFTGKLIAEYLQRHQKKENISLAFAGRNAQKLEQDLSGIPLEGISVEICDIQDPEQLTALTKNTKILMNAVGPFSFTGRQVIEACIQNKTHYLDITGEPSFVSDVYVRYHEAATEAGVCIINCCGFDSIPADLTTWLTAKQLPHDQPMILDGFVRTNAQFSGGTLNTAIEMLYRESKKTSAKFRVPRHPDTPKPKMRVHYNADIKAWAIPMPVVDPHIVKRSIYKMPLEFGYATAYRQFFVRSSFFKMVKTIMPVLFALLLAKYSWFRKYMKQKFPPGTGPSEAQRAASKFEFMCIGRSGDKKVTTTLSGGDPGYNETAKMFSLSAFTLLTKIRAGNNRSGVCTPSEALGQQLVDRLIAEGINIRQEKNNV
jgi:saccharopine dehydrogenase (NAD+, L-glutamate forming)